MKYLRILTASLIVAMSAALLRADGTNSNETAIMYGLEKSSVIVCGVTQGSFAGGGGVTSGLKVDDVFMGDEALKGKVIAVYWLDGKGRAKGRNIWFLKPHDRGYKETVGTKYPFVEATAENIRFLQSCIQKRQKPNKASEAIGAEAAPQPQR